MRPKHFTERQAIAERLYQLFVQAFNTHDFTEWYTYSFDYYDSSFFDSIVNYLGSVLGSNAVGNTVHSQTSSDYYDVLPPYSSGFASYMGYILCISSPVDVRIVLDRKFPRPDLMDCDYLDDILGGIQINIERGIGYDPGQKDGLDYYWQAENAVNFNMDSALRWVVRNRTALVELSESQTRISYKPLSATPQVPLKWVGKVADLAELLYRLERAGKIKLKDYFEKGGKGIDLSKSFTTVFLFEEGSPAETLNGYLSHLKKSMGEGPIDIGVMRKIGRKRGGNMEDMIPNE